MDELFKKLSQTDNDGWTVFDHSGGDGAAADHRMTLPETAQTDARGDTMNTIAAIGQLPDCAILVMAKEENLASLNTALELYASAKHFGHQANVLLLRGGDADAEAVAQKCKEIVLTWQGSAKK